MQETRGLRDQVVVLSRDRQGNLEGTHFDGIKKIKTKSMINQMEKTEGQDLETILE